MDKKDYLNTLKTTNMRPGKVKVEEFNPVILNEVPYDNEKEGILELFVQTGEIQSTPPGPVRDMQILRIGMIAELDASNFYEKLAGLAGDERVAKLMRDISYEEKVHAGEFETLLEEIDPDYEKAEEEGESEVEDMLGI
jgi:hypothetical protein